MRGLVIRSGRPSAQELEVDRVRDCDAASDVGVKVISDVVGGQKMSRLARVAQHQIGVNHAVECSARANPLIERHALRFVFRCVEAGKACVAAHRRYGAAENGQTVLVGPPYQLP